MRAAVVQDVFHKALAGEDISTLATGKFWGKGGKTDLRKFTMIKKFMEGEKAIKKFAIGYDYLGDNEKAETDFSGSFLNCSPSKICADVCYAATGTGASPTNFMKSEFTEYVANTYPQALLDNLEPYKNLPAGMDGLTLRLNEKGDLSNAQLKIIEALNKKDIRVQVFSKRPELLRKVSKFNWRALSIDGTNQELAIANPDLGLAVTVTDELSDKFMMGVKDRVNVTLPVNMKNVTWSPQKLEAILPMSYPHIKKTVCPVEIGKKLTKKGADYVSIIRALKEGVSDGEWTCATCDYLGVAGCFFGKNKSANVRKLRRIEDIEYNPTEEDYSPVAEALQNLKDKGVIDGKQLENLLAEVSKAVQETSGKPDTGTAKRDSAEVDATSGKDEEGMGGDVVLKQEKKNEVREDTRTATTGSKSATQPLYNWGRQKAEDYGVTTLEEAQKRFGERGESREVTIDNDGNITEIYRNDDNDIVRQRPIETLTYDDTQTARIIAGGNEQFAGAVESLLERGASDREAVGLALALTLPSSDVLFQEKQKPTPTWYSPTAKAVANMKQAKGNGKQMYAMLKKQDGVKRLAPQKSVTREQIAEFVEQNGVQVEEVVKGDVLTEDNFELDMEGNIVAGTETKHSEHQLPGGKNYKEILLTLPVVSEQWSKDFHNYNESLLSKYNIKNDDEFFVTITKAESTEWRRLYDRINKALADAYTSPPAHWDEQNILAFVRFNERTDKDGNRVLFLEEVQSDWSQEGRKKGFKGDVVELTLDERRKKQERVKKIDVELDGVEVGSSIHQNLLNESMDLQDDLAGVARYDTVPNTPFKKTPQWSGLAVKRMIRYAAENGFDSMAWTTGEQQAARYDLSKQVAAIGWRSFNNKYDLEIHTHENDVHFKKGLSAEELEANIGKEHANKIINSSYSSGEFRGLDLKVGGEGMKAFYNKMLPSTVNKLIKKSGSKVKVLEFPETGKQLGFPITKKMQESAVSEGMPLFQDKAKPYTPSGQVKQTLTGAKQKWQEIAEKNDLSAKAEKIITYLVDKDAPISRVQKQLPEQPEGRDYNLYRRLMGKKIADETEVFDKETLAPLLEYMAKSKLSVQDVEELAYAEHVPERNLQMKRINARRYIDSVIKEIPNNEAKALKDKISDIKKTYNSDTNRNRRRDAYVALMAETAAEYSDSEFSQTWNDVKDRLSGSTNAEAEQVVSDWKKKDNYAENKKAVDLLRKMGSDALEMSYNAGEIAKEEYDAMKSAYKKHVPLYREDRESSKSFSLTKVAAGSTRKVVDIFAHVVDNYQGTISRKHKLEASKVLYDMIKANPDESMWSLEEQEKAPYLDSEGNIRLYPDLKEPDNGIYIKVEGKKHLVTVPYDNKSMRRFMDALKDTPAQLGPVLKASQKVNRLLAQLNTAFSPEFMVTNFLRDIQTAGIHMEDTAAKGMQKKIYKDLKKSIVGIYKAETGKDAGVWGDIYADFKKNGGKISWMQGYENVDELAGQIEKDLEYVSGKRPKRAKFKKLMEFVSATNTSVENGVRLATYKHLLDSGVSKRKAAHIVSNLTVDFTRHGSAGPVINSLWMFANAGIQGNARMIKAVSKNKKVQKITGGIVAFGFAANIMGALAGGDDDDGEAFYDKLKRTNPSLFERNMVFMWPGSEGKHIKIPMPYGYGLFFVVGNEMASAIRNPDGYSNLEGMSHVMSTFLNTFNPIGAATVLQTISPTVTDPIVQSMENKSWHGGDLMPGVSPFGVSKPDSERYWKNVNPIAKWATQRLNSITGGSAVKSGVFDISPETVENMVENYTGSLGRFAKDVLSLPIKGFDEGIEAGDIPFSRKLFGGISEYADSKTYRENRDKVEIYKRERTIGGKADMPLRSMVGLTKSTEKRLRRMRKRLLVAEASGYDDRAKAIKERILILQRNYNKQFNSMVYN